MDDKLDEDDHHVTRGQVQSEKVPDGVLMPRLLLPEKEEELAHQVESHDEELQQEHRPMSHHVCCLDFRELCLSDGLGDFPQGHCYDYQIDGHEDPGSRLQDRVVHTLAQSVRLLLAQHVSTIHPEYSLKNGSNYQG